MSEPAEVAAPSGSKRLWRWRQQAWSSAGSAVDDDGSRGRGGGSPEPVGGAPNKLPPCTDVTRRVMKVGSGVKRMAPACVPATAAFTLLLLLLLIPAPAACRLGAGRQMVASSAGAADPTTSVAACQCKRQATRQRLRSRGEGVSGFNSCFSWLASVSRSCRGCMRCGLAESEKYKLGLGVHLHRCSDTA